MSLIIRTSDINVLKTQNEEIFFTKEKISEISQFLYKKLPLHGTYFTTYLDSNFNVGCIDLFQSNIRIGIYKNMIFDRSGLLFCKKYDEEYKEEIIEAIENFLYKVI